MKYIRLFFVFLFVFTPTLLLAVPTNALISFESDGPQCFKSSSHIVKAKWTVPFGNWYVLSDSDVVVTASGGTVANTTVGSTITYAKTGKYTITVKVTYTDCSTGINNGKKETITKATNLYLVVFKDLIVKSGADKYDGNTYTTAQIAGDFVIIKAVFEPDVTASQAPAMTWSGNGYVNGEDSLSKKVPKSAPLDEEISIKACDVNKTLRIYVREVKEPNTNTSIIQNPKRDYNSNRNDCGPLPLELEWEVYSDASNNKWYVRIVKIEAGGAINVKPWLNNPNLFTVPNTANPVYSVDTNGNQITGNINNIPNSNNNWKYAVNDMDNYNILGSGGAGPHWHSTDTSVTHEDYHWNTDWMTTSVGSGDWPNTETDIELLSISVFDKLTQADAKSALEAKVRSKRIKFNNIVITTWQNDIVPKDQPGKGGGAYAAGKLVLDQYINAVKAFAITRGW